MRDYALLALAIPFVIGARMLVSIGTKNAKASGGKITHNAASTEVLDNRQKPFEITATWRERSLQAVAKKITVLAVEGREVPESQAVIVTHLLYREVGSAEEQLIGFWRLWQIRDEESGQVVADNHAYLLGKAGLPPRPYPFIFEDITVQVPDQPAAITFSPGEGRKPLTARGRITSVMIKNSSVEKFVLTQSKPGDEEEKSRTFSRQKFKTLSIVPDGAEAPVEDAWEWVLRLGREWRRIDESDSFQPAAGEDGDRRRASEEELI